MNWKPRASDIEWTRSHIARINNGGTWIIPMNGSIWRINHTDKKLVCTSGPKDDMYDRITIVCQHLGYTTEYAAASNATVLTAADAGSGKLTERMPGISDNWSRN
jgi:hypothetical protein